MGMMPQSSLAGANASTSVPQNLQSPPQLNANAMNNSVQKAQLMGKPTAAAVTQAAANPTNKYYAQGGSVMPPSKPELDAKMASYQPDAKSQAVLSKALEGSTVMKGQDKSSSAPAKKSSSGDSTEDMFKSYDTQAGKAMMSDRNNGFKDTTDMPQSYAKGGEAKKDMSLKDIVKMLAAHPDVMQGAGNAGAPMTGSAMSKGGATANTQGKATPSSHGRGLMAMNDDVGTYAQGGNVNSGGTGTSDNEVSDNSAGMMDGKATGGHGIIKMASGGAADDSLQAGSIQGYAPDGTPIVQGSNGGESEANINDLLGRPSNAPTLGTGATPQSTAGEAKGNSSAANALGGNGLMSQTMAKGGEEAGPPPGSNINEVADKIPAQLSEGEFVFSADVTRFYGLRTLHMMQDHAREELDKMNSDGAIRHPGDGKDINPGGQFLQDQKPNMNAYNGQDGDEGSASEVGGLLKECSGGSVGMATGGGVGEEQSLRAGGSVYGKDQYPIGRDNMVSAHPKGGAVAQDYKGGGLVNSKMDAMLPKPSPTLIPSGEAKIPGLKKINATPKFAMGGLVNYNSNINKETTQSSVGS